MEETTTPVPPLPCDTVDQLAPPSSPVKPEVEKRSPPREFVKSPETAADASPHAHNDGVTCDAPASPIGAVSTEQEREQALTPPSASPYRFMESQNDTKTSYFGESHVTRLQSFVDSVAATDDVTSSWSRGRISSEPTVLCRPVPPRTCTQLRQPVPHQPAVDEPLDLSLKPPSSLRRPDPPGEVPFPVPMVAPSLFPLLYRDSWIAHWAALAAASLQHSLLFPVTSHTAVDNTTSGQAAWMTSTSPRSSSSSSSPGGCNMADERRRRTALTAMESFVESSFKRHKPPLATSGHELSHVTTNRKRRRRVGPPEITSSGDEDGGGSGEREKTGTGSVSPRSDDMTSRDDEPTDKQSSVTSPDMNGETGIVGYLSCDAQDAATKEHPLVSLEKFVGVSAPLFPPSTTPPSALTINGLSCGKTPSYGDDCAPEVVTSRSMRGGDVDSGSLGRGFTSVQSLLCCNL